MFAATAIGSRVAAIVWALLCGIAGRMHAKLVSSLSMAEVSRVAQEILTRESGESRLFEELLSSSLMQVCQGRLRVSA